MLFLILAASGMMFLDICLMINSGRIDRAQEQAKFYKELKEREAQK